MLQRFSKLACAYIVEGHSEYHTTLSSNGYNKRWTLGAASYAKYYKHRQGDDYYCPTLLDSGYMSSYKAVSQFIRVKEAVGRYVQALRIQNGWETVTQLCVILRDTVFTGVANVRALIYRYVLLNLAC